MDGVKIPNTSALSPAEENKKINFFSPQKSLNLSDLKKSFMEVEVMQEAKDNTATSASVRTSASAKQRKKKARKQRKKRSRAIPYIHPTSVVDALYEILHDIVENDDILPDDPERERLVRDITEGRLTKDNLNKKLAEQW